MSSLITSPVLAPKAGMIIENTEGQERYAPVNPVNKNEIWSCIKDILDNI